MKQSTATVWLIVANLAAIANPFPGQFDIRGAVFSVRDFRQAEVTADVYVRPPVDMTVLRIRMRRATLGGMPCSVTVPVQRRQLRRGVAGLAAERAQITVPLFGFQSLQTVYSIVTRGTVELQGDLEVDVETVQSFGGVIVRGQGTYSVRIVTAVNVAKAVAK